MGVQLFREECASRLEASPPAFTPERELRMKRHQASVSRAYRPPSPQAMYSFRICSRAECTVSCQSTGLVLVAPTDLCEQTATSGPVAVPERVNACRPVVDQDGLFTDVISAASQGLAVFDPCCKKIDPDLVSDGDTQKKKFWGSPRVSSCESLRPARRLAQTSPVALISHSTSNSRTARAGPRGL